MATLEEIRAKLLASDQKRNSVAGDNNLYPFWNMNDGDSVKVRFLPDGDNSNDFFWVERGVIKMPFNGIKGDPKATAVVVRTPCMEQWNETCPVLSEIRPWFKMNDSAMEDLARKYWVKRSYIFQGFVRGDNPIDEESPDNPIRRFVLTSKLFDLVKNALMDPEITELPVDYKRGLDFTIRKTKSGGYANYTTSNWARKESALTEDELQAIDEHSLFELKEFLPKKPNADDITAIEEMFRASVDGEPYDPERWGQHYRPYGMDAPGRGNAESTDTPSSKKDTTSKREAESKDEHKNVESNVEDSPPFEADNKPAAKTGPGGGGQKVDDILAQIRARKAS